MVRPLKVAIASVPSWHIAMPPGGGVHSIDDLRSPKGKGRGKTAVGRERRHRKGVGGRPPGLVELADRRWTYNGASHLLPTTKLPRTMTRAIVRFRRPDRFQEGPAHREEHSNDYGGTR